MTRMLVVCAFLIFAAPAAAQVADHRVEAVATAIELKLAAWGRGDTPRARILLDTPRTLTGTPLRRELMEQLVQRLGVQPGNSEDHCRRFPVAMPRYGWPIGYEVHGVDAIVSATLIEFAPDSIEVTVTAASGTGEYVGGMSTYTMRRELSGWRTTQNLTSGPHGWCVFRRVPEAIAVGGRALLDSLNANGPTCLDPTGFPLHEIDAVAALLGADVRGRYLPWRGEEPMPVSLLNPCERSGEDWGSVLRILHVEWPSDDLILVEIEVRQLRADVPDDERVVRVEYTLRKVEAEWIIAERS
jgi:hypothetical protein